MTRPPSRSRGMACWVVKNGPLTFVANTRSKSASVGEAVVPTTATPALFTRMSKRRSPRRACQLGVERLEEPAQLLDGAHVGLDRERLAAGRLDLLDDRSCRLGIDCGS